MLASLLLWLAVPALGAPPEPVAGTGVLQARALIKAKHQAVLSNDVEGRIVKLSIREGESFRKGDRLFEIDCAPYQASAAAARATLAHDLAKLNASQTLVAMHSGGRLDVDLAQADVDKARAELRTATLRVERCGVDAPFDGRVVEVKAHAFETVPPNTPVLAILDDTDLEISLVIPSNWLAWLKPGAPFTLEVDETGTRPAAQVTRIGAQIDPVSQTVTVFGSFVDRSKGLVAGMSGTASFAAPDAAASTR